MSTFTLHGLHCANCVTKVTEALTPLDPTVQVTTTEATFTAAVTEAQVNAALAPLGKYHAHAGTGAHHHALVAAKPLLSPTLTQWLTTYRPIWLITLYLLVVSFTAATSVEGFMTTFMAGFFLIFSAFKFLNLSGFADAYSTYDLLAARSRKYALAYPFIELALGLAYLWHIAPTLTNVATLILMVFSSFGVLKALQQKRTIQCACLGTALNLPMTTLTLVEDLLMAAMAALMLIF